MPDFQSDAEIMAVVKGFETCETDKTAFKHQDHLVVAVVYLNGLTVPEAAAKMRASLLRFVEHHQVDQRKYNETITVFWTEIVRDALGKLEGSLSLFEKCNSVIQNFPNSSLPLDYYSSELLFSDEARARFVSPDLKDWKI